MRTATATAAAGALLALAAGATAGPAHAAGPVTWRVIEATHTSSASIATTDRNGTSTMTWRLVRPTAKAHLESRMPHHLDGVQALIGRTARVTRPVDGSSGRIQVGADEWTARAEFDDTFDVGTTVRILQVDGATAVVGDAME